MADVRAPLRVVELIRSWLRALGDGCARHEKYDDVMRSGTECAPRGAFGCGMGFGGSAWGKSEDDVRLGRDFMRCRVSERSFKCFKVRRRLERLSLVAEWDWGENGRELEMHLLERTFVSDAHLPSSIATLLEAFSKQYHILIYIAKEQCIGSSLLLRTNISHRH